MMKEVQDLIDNSRKKPIEDFVDGNHHVENALDAVSEHLSYQVMVKTTALTENLMMMS